MERLDQVLSRSLQLRDTLFDLLAEAEGFDDSDRGQASFSACSVSLEHGDSVKVLISEGLPTSAIGMLRMQYEAVARGIWLAYTAGDDDISRIRAPLTSESERAASKMPSVKDMLTQLEGKAPLQALEMLWTFRNVSWSALNSYVHGGIHAIKRQTDGYPIPLLVQIVQNANALKTMAAMMLALLSGDPRITKPMSKIQREFRDCLPELLPIPAKDQFEVP